MQSLIIMNYNYTDFCYFVKKFAFAPLSHLMF